LGYNHKKHLQSHKGVKTGVYLPLVHLIISNLKRNLLGTYRGAVHKKHLPAYLNEYVFRFNRRFWRGPAFLRCLELLVSSKKWPEYETLYSGAWVHPNPADDFEIEDMEG
jgi:transposase-like protein